MRTETAIRKAEIAAANGEPGAQARLEYLRARAGLCPACGRSHGDESGVIGPDGLEILQCQVPDDWPNGEMVIKIDGEIRPVEHIIEVSPFADVAVVELDNGEEWCLIIDRDVAVAVARNYYEDLAHQDPREFRALIGDDTLVAWAIGHSDGAGCSSFEEWLDLVASVPEEFWATYDHMEIDVEAASKQLVDEIGFMPKVAYRRL